MKDVLEIFRRVESSLRAKPWFKKNGWLAAHHPFPAHEPEAITLHVFKAPWFNADTRGIHFESFLFLDEKKRRKSSVHLHILHEDLIPGTSWKRMKISRPLVDMIGKEVSSWPGYKFRAGKYGLQPFTCELDGASPAYASALTAELERLCLFVGPKVDQVLKALIES